MSLATRCPACGTTFKVVRDQLRISDGWVRCGRCADVFDGTAHLQESTPAAVAPDAPPALGTEGLPALPSAPPSTLPAAEAPTGALADLNFFGDALLRLSARPSDGDAATVPGPHPAIIDHIPQPPRSQPVALEAPSFSWPAFTHYAPAVPVPVIEFPAEAVEAADVADADEAAVTAATPALLHGADSWPQLPSLHLGALPLPDAQGPRLVDEPAVAEDLQFQKALRRARIQSLKLARAKAKAEAGQAPGMVRAPSESAVETIDDGNAASAMPSLVAESPISRATDRFDRASAAPIRWRGLLRVATLTALLLLLGVQVLHQERNAIIARQPAWRPAFATACEWIGCQLSAVRQIADIRIDGASFAREKNGEGYQFSFTLRNLAAIPLAMPAVELSLLDTQERTVVRRVLQPADYAAPATLAAHAERAALLAVQLAGEDAAALPHVAGFRLDAFYP